MFPLILSVKTSSWRNQDDSSELANEAYQNERYKILVRDEFTCQACGFVTKPERDKRTKDESYLASGYLEVHHIDDNHHNNNHNNMVTLCPFCHQVFTVGLTGHRNAAKVIYFPYLSQAEINLLANLSLVQDNAENEMSDWSAQFLMWLESFESQAQRIYGDEIIDPKNLGAALFQLYKVDPKLYENRENILYGLRLLPKATPYKKALDWWGESKCWTPPNQWKDIFEDWKGDQEAIKEEL